MSRSLIDWDRICWTCFLKGITSLQREKSLFTATVDYLYNIKGLIAGMTEIITINNIRQGNIHTTFFVIWKLAN